MIDMKETAGGPSSKQTLRSWVDLVAQLCEPSRVQWCDGSEGENAALIADMVARAAPVVALVPGARRR